jgi:hypothetical protein
MAAQQPTRFPGQHATWSNLVPGNFQGVFDSIKTVNRPPPKTCRFHSEQHYNFLKSFMNALMQEYADTIHSKIIAHEKNAGPLQPALDLAIAWRMKYDGMVCMWGIDRIAPDVETVADGVSRFINASGRTPNVVFLKQKTPKYPGQSADLENLIPGDHKVCYRAKGFPDQMASFHSKKHQECLQKKMDDLILRMNQELLQAGQVKKDGLITWSHYLELMNTQAQTLTITRSQYLEMMNTFVADYYHLVEEWGIDRLTPYLQSVIKGVVEEVLPMYPQPE